MIDLDDLKNLNEDELKELRDEERMFIEDHNRQNEYFKQDDANSQQRHYIQLRILYKIRGRALEEVTNRLTAYQDEMMREKRAMTHKIAMSEKENQETKSKLEQALEREILLKNELDKSIRMQSDSSDIIEKLKQVFTQSLAEMHSNEFTLI